MQPAIIVRTRRDPTAVPLRADVGFACIGEPSADFPIFLLTIDHIANPEARRSREAFMALPAGACHAPLWRHGPCRLNRRSGRSVETATPRQPRLTQRSRFRGDARVLL